MNTAPASIGSWSFNALTISFLFEVRAPAGGFAELSQIFDWVLRSRWQKVCLPLEGEGIHFHRHPPRLIALDGTKATIVILAQFNSIDAFDKAISRLDITTARADAGAGHTIYAIQKADDE